MQAVKDLSPETVLAIAQTVSSFGKPKGLVVRIDGNAIIDTIDDPIMKMSFAKYAETEAASDYPKMKMITT